MAIAIRDATPADLPAIGRIYVLGHWAAFRGHVPIGHLRSMSAALEAAVLGQELANPAATFLVAANSRQRVIGFALGGPSTPLVTGLAELFVERKYWGKGAAYLLLHAMSQRMTAIGCTQMRAVVAKVNVRSRKFCQKHGSGEVDNGDWIPVFDHVFGVQAINLDAVWEDWPALP